MDRRKFLKDLVGVLLGVAISPSILLAESRYGSIEEKLFPLYNKIVTRFNLDDEEYTLLVDGKNQKMYLVNGLGGFRINKTYTISTGKSGFGNESGSGKTPTGIHRIKEMYGDNAPIRTIFRARQNTGKVAMIYTDEYDSPEDLVTSRIMWLRGCEDQNRNSHSRFIYIHGTPEEGLIGKPVSHGCIRMKNKDVIELYDLVSPGTYVNIRNNVS